MTATTPRLRDRVRITPRQLWALAVAPQGNLVAVGDGDGTVAVYDVGERRIRTFEPGHTGRVTSVAFSANGQVLASGSYDQTVCLWDVATGSTQTPSPAGVREIFAVAFSDDGQRLAVGGYGSGSLRRLAPSEGIEAVGAQLGGHNGPVLGLRFRPGFDELLSVDRHRGIKLWNARTGALLRTITLSEIQCAAYWGDGSRLAVGTRSGWVHLLHADTGRGLDQWSAWAGEIETIAVSPSGKSVAIGGNRGRVAVWATDPRQELANFRSHRESVRGVAFAPDGGFLAVVGSHGWLNLWEMTTLSP